MMQNKEIMVAYKREKNLKKLLKRTKSAANIYQKLDKNVKEAVKPLL